MNGRRTIAATQDATHRNHHNVHQKMLTIPEMPRVGQRLEVRPYRFNVHQFGCHATYPGMRQAESPSDPRSRYRATTAKKPRCTTLGPVAPVFSNPLFMRAGPAPRWREQTLAGRYPATSGRHDGHGR